MNLDLRVRGRAIQIPEPRWTELWSGVASLLWSAYVFWMPEQLGDRAPYTVLGGIATDNEWAAASTAIGGMQIVFSIMNWRLARAFGTTLSSALWTCLFTGIVAAHDQSFPGVVLYFNQILMNFFSLTLVLLIMILVRSRKV